MRKKTVARMMSAVITGSMIISLAACGSTGDALEILDTESAQTEQTGQETATATPATSQTTPETTTEPKPKNLTYQTGLYQEKTLADQVSVDAVRELPEGEYGVLSYSYDETVSVWGNGAEDCLVIHDGDREYKVDVPWRNMYSAPPAVEAADYDGDGDKEYYISTIQGTGTGVYVEGLYYVDVQKGTPKVSEYTQVVEDFDRRILVAELDEEFHTLHMDFLDKNGEIDAQESIDLDLTRLLQKMEGYTYKSTGMGAQVRFEFRGGQPAFVAGGRQCADELQYG